MNYLQEEFQKIKKRKQYKKTQNKRENKLEHINCEPEELLSSKAQEHQPIKIQSYESVNSVIFENNYKNKKVFGGKTQEAFTLYNSTTKGLMGKNLRQKSQQFLPNFKPQKSEIEISIGKSIWEQRVDNIPLNLLYSNEKFKDILEEYKCNSYQLFSQFEFTPLQNFNRSTNRQYSLMSLSSKKSSYKNKQSEITKETQLLNIIKRQFIEERCEETLQYQYNNLSCLMKQVNDQELMLVFQDFSKIMQIKNSYDQSNFKNKVVNSFSHELRTPLNSASLFLKALMLDENMPSELKNIYVQPAISSLIRQSHLINDIIDFSQINAETIDFKYKEFQIKELIEDITNMFLYEFTQKGIGLAFDIKENIPKTLKNDYQRLTQILINLIQNSCKFSEKGYVLISISKNNEDIQFTVRDEGVGIGFEKLLKIQSSLQNSQGNEWHGIKSIFQNYQGFGLVITQMLIKYLGPIDGNSLNQLQIDSGGQNMGTTVSFKIKDYFLKYLRQSICQQKKKMSRGLSVPILSDNQGLIITIKSKSKSQFLLSEFAKQSYIDFDDSFINNVSDQIGQYNYPIKKFKSQLGLISSQIQSLKSKECLCNTILSVDDEIFNQSSLEMILRRLGFEVEKAYNGKQAIVKMQQKIKCCQQCKKYKLILMDCQMPVMDGWKATFILEEMFSLGQLPRIPIIGLTAFTSSKDIQKCHDSGMKQVLSKPLSIKKFSECLDDLGI